MVTIMSTEIGKYIRLIRESHGGRGFWSIRSVASRANISNSYLSQIETGKVKQPLPDVLRKLSEALRHPYEDLMDAAGYLPSETEIVPKNNEYKKIPVVSWVHANQFELIEDPFPPGIAEEYIRSEVKGDHTFALKVKNDCMEPEFREGDIIIVNPDIQAESSDFVIVKDNEENEATFKQLKRYGDKTILHPLNPKYNDIELNHDERYQIVGVVVEKIKKYR